MCLSIAVKTLYESSDMATPGAVSRSALMDNVGPTRVMAVDCLSTLTSHTWWWMCSPLHVIFRYSRVSSVKYLLVAWTAVLAAGCGTSRAERAQLSAACASAGAQAFERYKAALVERYQELTSMLDTPEYHFNLRLNTCLMTVGHWSMIPHTQRNQWHQDSALLNEVIDVYANKTVVSGGHTNRYDAAGNMTTTRLGTNPLDFREKAEKLMVE